MSRGVTRLSIRFLSADLPRNLLFATTLALSVALAALSFSIGSAIIGRMERDAQRLFGSARITIPAAERSLAGSGGWFTRADLSRIAELLDVEDVRVVPRLEFDAVTFKGSDFEPVSVQSAELAPSERTMRASPATPVYLAAESRDAPGRASWMRLDDALPSLVPTGEHVIQLSHHVFLRFLRDRGFAESDDVGNVLVVETADGRSPAVVAFNSLELLAPEIPGVTVQSRDEIAWLSPQFSAANIAFLARLLLMLPAAAAVFAIVLVSAETRGNELGLLHTMGYGIPLLRSIAVREIFLLSVFGTLLGILIALLVSLAVPAYSSADARYGVIAFLGILGPPAVTFVITRTALNRRLPQRLAGRTGGGER